MRMIVILILFLSPVPAVAQDIRIPAQRLVVVPLDPSPEGWSWSAPAGVDVRACGRDLLVVVPPGTHDLVGARSDGGIITFRRVRVVAGDGPVPPVPIPPNPVPPVPPPIPPVPPPIPPVPPPEDPLLRTLRDALAKDQAPADVKREHVLRLAAVYRAGIGHAADVSNVYLEDLLSDMREASDKTLPKKSLENLRAVLREQLRQTLGVDPAAKLSDNGLRQKASDLFRRLAEALEKA